MCMGVTRLGGSWGKKQVWRPNVWTWGLSKANVLCLKILWLLDPPSDLAPWELCSLAHLVTSLLVCNKNRKIFRNKFSSPNVMNFYSMNICNFRTQYGMDLAQTDCQRRSLAAFQVSSLSFVSLLWLPHAFLRPGPVFVLLIFKLFREWNKLLFKVR